MSTDPARPASDLPTAAPDQERLSSLLSKMWKRNLPEIEARIAVLDRAASAAIIGPLAPDLHQEALSVAHKLAGSLGMYGYWHASELARLIEQLLEANIPIQSTRLLDQTAELRRAIQT